jgi:hypothetical protein
MKKARIKMTPLERFMLDQQQIVASVLGVRFISFPEFVKQIGYSENKAKKILLHGKVPGAQIVNFEDRPRWIIPENHNFKKHPHSKPRMSISKSAFENHLNECGCPEDLFIEANIRGRIVKRQVKNYGTWLRSRRKEEFDNLYNEFKKEHTALPTIKRKKNIKPSRSHAYLFPL